MSDTRTYLQETAADLNRRIASAQMRSTVAADALAALIRTGVETAEAEQHLNAEMDTLLVLRRQLAELLLPDEPSDLSPAACD